MNITSSTDLTHEMCLAADLYSASGAYSFNNQTNA